MPTVKTLTNSLKNASSVLWSISLCQKTQDIVEVAECLRAHPQIINVTLNLPDILERFNILADIIFKLQQGKKELGISEGIFGEINKLLEVAADRWNDDEVETALMRMASFADIQQICLDKSERWLRDNLQAIELLQKAGKGGRVIRWQEVTSQESFLPTLSEVTHGVKENSTLQRGITGEVTNKIRKNYNSAKGITRRLIETLCRLYLLEEAAWRILAGQRSEHEYEVYYGTLAHALLDIYRKHGGNPNTMKLISVIDAPQEADRIKTSSSVAAKLPFFSQGQVFACKMSVQKENHVWKAACEIQFSDEIKLDEAVKFLLTNILAAKNSYIGAKDMLSYPVVLQSSQQLIGFAVSYRIEMLDNTVFVKVNPFDILIREIETDYEQRKELREEILKSVTISKH